MCTHIEGVHDPGAGSRETNAEDLYFVIMVHGQRSDAEALWGGAACL